MLATSLVSSPEKLSRYVLGLMMLEPPISAPKAEARTHFAQLQLKSTKRSVKTLGEGDYIHLASEPRCIGWGAGSLNLRIPEFLSQTLEKFV